MLQPTTPYTRQDFTYDLGRARRGQSVRYHTGLLMNDRTNDKNVHAVGNAAWGAYLSGVCTLVQRRVSPSSCEYLAVRT